jgi:hypothetical protein
MEGQVDGSVLNITIATFTERESISVIKFAGGTIRLCVAPAVRYGGILGITYGIRTRRVLGVLL